MLALIMTDQLKEMNQILVKQLKNRSNSVDNPNKFVIGVDKSRMKLYDLEQIAQTTLSNSTPPTQHSGNTFGTRTNKFNAINV